MSLPRFGVTRPVPVNLLMVAMLAGGLFFALTIRREFFPEIDPEAASVSLPYPGATPLEIEESMAVKVEDAIRDLEEVDTLRTTISEGGGGIIVEFREGISDIPAAVDDLERRIDGLRDLPADAERIQVAEFEARLPVIMVSVHGDIDEEVLKRTMRETRDDLRELPGMGEVLAGGVRDYEVRVDVDTLALLEHGISLPQVTDAIQSWMADVPGGSVRSDVGNVNVRTIGVLERADAIRQIVVKADLAGQALRVEDIATVRESFVDTQLITRFDGHPSANLTVFKVGDLDLVKMAEMTRAYVDGRTGKVFDGLDVERLFNTVRYQAYVRGASAPALPRGCVLTTHSDLARFVEGRLQLLVENACYGAILVFGTLLLFLNWRVALWVGIGLLTALAGTLILMRVTGVTLNLLTMFGLIVVLGILVDDAIVVAENIQARHDRGEPSLLGAIRGAEQVFWPVVATVLTTIVAFMPLTFVRGRIGDLLGALPMVVTCALAISLVESLLILPSHMGHSLVRRDQREPGGMARALRRFEAWRDDIILNRIVPMYARLLERALRFRYLSLTLAVSTLIASASIFAGGWLQFVFLPSDDTETVVVSLRMSLGTSIERTTDVATRIETAARDQEEVKSVSAVIGQRSNLDTGAIDATASHLAELYLELYPVELRERSSTEVTDSIRQAIGTINEVEHISYSQITGGPGGPDITIELRGADTDELVAATGDVKEALSRFQGVYDIFDDHAIGQRELQIKLKPGAAALGFSVADVARQVRGALFGLDAHVFSERGEDIDVRVRLEEETRRSLWAVENLWVISPAGKRVPLMEVADLVEGSSYATIKRINGARAITVTAETAAEISPEAISAEFRDESLELLRAKHPTVTIEMAGRAEQMADAFGSLPMGFLAAMVVIYVILAWLFSSYTLPIAVMLAVPFAIIGVLWGHLILGFDLTFLSMIGFVALSGIVVNDSLILMKFYHTRRVEGDGMHEALIEAGRQRLRPIFLTTITTVLGLTPLMLEQSFQARFLIPMAISISFGLMSSTGLILIVLPCVVVIVEDVRSACYYLWNGRRRPEVGPVHRAIVDMMGEG